ncbi:MAG: hypothetical protein GEV07_16170 [Streptosporangiales bacterium]|nr:hypothetical protein [Streptosporangiales bacterium]
MNGRLFHKNVDALAADHRVITIDSRGHGRSGKEFMHLTMEQVGRDIETVLAALDLRDVVLARLVDGHGDRGQLPRPVRHRAARRDRGHRHDPVPVR